MLMSMMKEVEESHDDVNSTQQREASEPSHVELSGRQKVVGLIYVLKIPSRQKVVGLIYVLSVNCPRNAL